MKVLFDLQYLNVASTGIKTYILEIIKAIKENPNPEIEWIFTHDPEEQMADRTFKGPQSKIKRLNYHLDYFRWKEFQLPDLVKKIRPDVLICPDFVSPAASLPCKRITVIYDAFFWQMPQNYPAWWRTYFLGLINKGLKEDTHIVTITDYSKRSLQDSLKRDLPISIVYPISKTMADSSGMAYLDELSLEEKKYFLHIGTFDVRKNIPVLVRAFHEFLEKTGLDFKLVLAGGKGQSSQMNDWPHVQRLVQELGLSQQVLLPGYVSDSEVRALYEGAFCYCFPSENEGFGIPVVEAMSLGVPVIHSDQPALIEVSGGAGLVSKTGDSADLAEKMILLSSNKSLQSDLIAQGKQRAADFTAKKLIQDFHQVILSLQE